MLGFKCPACGITRLMKDLKDGQRFVMPPCASCGKGEMTLIYDAKQRGFREVPNATA